MTKNKQMPHLHVELPESTHKKLRIKAIEQDTTLKELITETLQKRA